MYELHTLLTKSSVQNLILKAQRYLTDIKKQKSIFKYELW